MENYFIKLGTQQIRYTHTTYGWKTHTEQLYHFGNINTHLLGYTEQIMRLKGTRYTSYVRMLARTPVFIESRILGLPR